MIISFDIDNTLIPYSGEFAVEKRGIWADVLGVEPLRKGTIGLFKELERRNHQIWIYTTSFRTPFNLKKTFKYYGLSPVRIINETINRQELNKHYCSASKNPGLFGIDIHVDDSRGVEIEGEKYGFSTIIIGVEDENWVKRILKVVDEVS